MKGMLKFIIVVIALSQLSCGNQQAQPLTIEVRHRNVILIDGSGRSCTKQNSTQDLNPNEDDLSPVKALLGGVRIEWRGEKDLEILYLRIRLTPNGSPEQLINLTGAELGYALINSPARVVMRGGSSQVIDSSTVCNLEVGGINVGDKTRSQFGQGSILVYGTTLQNGQQVPVQAQGFFSFQFDGIN